MAAVGSEEVVRRRRGWGRVRRRLERESKSGSAITGAKHTTMALNASRENHLRDRFSAIQQFCG